jgi:hypothetical protein
MNYLLQVRGLLNTFHDWGVHEIELGYANEDAGGSVAAGTGSCLGFSAFRRDPARALYCLENVKAVITPEKGSFVSQWLSGCAWSCSTFQNGSQCSPY